MRCSYLSDLHLESESFEAPLAGGDVLILAGDLCHARSLDPTRTDRPSVEQRARTLRFVDRALAAFGHVLLVAGNHEPYDGVVEDTPGLLRRHLPGVRLLDDEAVEVGGVRIFGTTLWSDFEGRSPAVLAFVRRRMGEYFFVRTRADDGSLERFRPEDALAAHDRALAALSRAVAAAGVRPLVVVTHHAPSRQGLNPFASGNGLDGAYASDLDGLIAGLPNVPVWVHGHTHIARRYRIGATRVVSNARGFAGKGQGARGFSPAASFEIDDRGLGRGVSRGSARTGLSP